MIRLLASLFFVFHGSLLFGQWVTYSKPIPFPIDNFQTFIPYEKSGGSLIVNYDLSDETNAGSANYKRALWPINQNYDTLSTDSLLTFLICGFDSLIDPTNTYAYDYMSIPSFHIDSIWIALGHENNSGLNDTLIIQLIQLNSLGYPSSQVVWSDTLIFSSGLSPFNQWTNTLILPISPNLNWNYSFKPAVKLCYKAPLNDTLGVIAGYHFSGSCGAADAAQWSAFYPNSYAYWTGFNALIPTSAGGDIYYDCNHNLEFDTLIDGRNFIQNWHIGLQITAPEIGLDSYHYFQSPKVFPNPASDRIYIIHDQTILHVEIFNTHGLSVLFSNNISNPITLQNLHDGMYFIHIKTATHSYVKKILVHHTLY